jgi:hypothetical protein
MPDWVLYDPQLRQLHAEGVTPAELARRINLPPQTVRDRLIKLGLLSTRPKAKKSPPEENAMPDEVVEVLPGQMQRDEDRVSAVADISPVSELSEPLSPAEVQTLEHYEEIIALGIKTFVLVGHALLTIRDRRLYRGAYSTFEDYCRQRWDLSRPYAYQLMEASAVVENVSAVADIAPANEAQARPLTTLPAEQQREVWQEVVDTAPPSGITATHVQETVNRVKGKPTRTPQPKLRAHKSPEPQPAEQKALEWYEQLFDGLKDLNALLKSLIETNGGVTVQLPELDSYRQGRLLEFSRDMALKLSGMAEHIEKMVVGKSEEPPELLTQVWQTLGPLLARIPPENARLFVWRVPQGIKSYAESLRDQVVADYLKSEARRVERLIWQYGA